MEYTGVKFFQIMDLLVAMEKKEIYTPIDFHKISVWTKFNLNPRCYYIVIRGDILSSTSEVEDALKSEHPSAKEFWENTKGYVDLEKGEFNSYYFSQELGPISENMIISEMEFLKKMCDEEYGTGIALVNVFWTRTNKKLNI